MEYLQVYPFWKELKKVGFFFPIGIWEAEKKWLLQQNFINEWFTLVPAVTMWLVLH